jgi:uncharacterized protein (DUF1015 family)
MHSRWRKTEGGRLKTEGGRLKMAHIEAFKGICYNPKKIKDPADVCTPPYDVISNQEQKAFYDRHENNVIRLILGKAVDGDTEADNPHTRAAGYFKDWVAGEILVQDDKPAIYLTSVQFVADSQIRERFGMIVRVGLEPFDKKIILPHEKTFSKVKSERLDLMKRCHVNFSPIFSLYPDSNNAILNQLKEKTKDSMPDTDFKDHKGLRHRLWRITDPSVHRFVGDSMADKPLFIADGHHRYETALNYREWLAQTDPGFSPGHPANFVMMYLCGMDEPGLTILPAHRLLVGLSQPAIDSFLEKAKNYFEITTFPVNKGNPNAVKADFKNSLYANHLNKTIGVCIKNGNNFYLMKTKGNAMAQSFSNELPDPLLHLDVSILTHLIFIKILGFDMDLLDNEKLIRYTSDTAEAMEMVDRNQCDIAFILNPTKIEQVKQVAEMGLIMPRKSTYFYPKVITGQVMHKLYP